MFLLLLSFLSYCFMFYIMINQSEREIEERKKERVREIIDIVREIDLTTAFKNVYSVLKINFFENPHTSYTISCTKDTWIHSTQCFNNWRNIRTLFDYCKFLLKLFFLNLLQILVFLSICLIFIDSNFVNKILNCVKARERRR